MNLHGQIINLQMPPDATIKATLDAEPQGDWATIVAYKYGHRDARHAAAEMMIAVDVRIAELEAMLTKICTASRAIQDLGLGCTCDVSNYCAYCDEQIKIDDVAADWLDR